jgi:hypothetical protein
MYLPTLLLAAGATLAVAQDSKTFPFFFPSGSEGEPPVAEVSIKNPTTTIARIECPSGTPSYECGWGAGLDYTVISTTIYEITMEVPDQMTMSVSCDHNTKQSKIACDVSVGGQMAIPGSSLLELTGSEIQFVTASVTGGSVPKASNTADETTPATSSATPSATSGTAALASSGEEASGSPTASGSAPQDTSAAYKYGIEGSALVALAGAAALNLL